MGNTQCLSTVKNLLNNRYVLYFCCCPKVFELFLLAIACGCGLHAFVTPFSVAVHVMCTCVSCFTLSSNI